MPHDQFNIPRYLAVLPLFSDLSANDLGQMAKGCELRRLKRGDTLFRYGEPCQEFHVVITGQIKLFALSPAGQEKVIELVGPGHSFAEALMFTDKPYILNAQALSTTLLLTVSKYAIVAEIERDPRFSMRMLAGISRRLHGLVHDIETGALQSGIQRVIGYLLREHHNTAKTEDEAFTVALPVSKATIASRLSLTPEYFSKVLRELEEKGLIAMDKRDIRIIDAQRLVSYGVQ